MNKTYVQETHWGYKICDPDCESSPCTCDRVNFVDGKWVVYSTRVTVESIKLIID